MTLLVVSLIVLLFLSAFFSASETALMSLSRTEVRRMSSGGERDRAVCRLLKNPQSLLSTVLVGNMFVNVLLASIFSTFMTRLLDTDDGLGVFESLAKWVNPGIGETAMERFGEICRQLLNVLIVTPLLMICGEQTPKVLAYAHGAFIARAAARPLQLLCIVLTPINLLMRGMANAILMLFGQSGMENWREMTIDELLATISAGQETGATDGSEHKILSNTVGIGGITVKEVMTHRLDVTMLPDDITVNDAFSIAMEKRYSLYPVCSGNNDGVWGVFSLMSLPFWRGKPEMNMLLSDFRDKVDEASAEQLPVTKPYYVPETARIDSLLYDMRRKAASFCIVVDEYGGVSGVVTLNDIMEELLGHFSQKNSDDEDTIYKTDNGTFIANGHAHLRVLQQKFGEEFESEEGDSDTLGGLIMEILGSVPRSKTNVTLKNGTVLTVLRMKGSRVLKVRITPPVIIKEEEA